MAYLNKNYSAIKESYLFSDIAKRIQAFQSENPEKKVIKMGIGDVTLPLAPVVVEAMKKACDEMSVKETFRGYGPEQGYDFLRAAIKGYYKTHNVDLEPDEIFISDGAKSDVGNITDLFSNENIVLIPDPVYPVYVDSNIMLGRKIRFVDATEENRFTPLPPKEHADIIYLCSPNNPTGAVFSKEQLKAWVDYAVDNNAVILFDAAYECFVRDPELPRSIYEIEGAKKCAIEFCSFSKTAGFTGTRCGYTVVPKELIIKGEELNLNKMWNRRQTTKFNGVPYIVQRGAEAVFSDIGQKQIHDSLDYYSRNALYMADTMKKLNIPFTGGENSPYIWLRCPNEMDSWTFFDYLLNKIAVVGTPGAGFGENGKNYFRLTAFSTYENTIEAMSLFESLFK